MGVCSRGESTGGRVGVLHAKDLLITLTSIWIYKGPGIYESIYIYVCVCLNNLCL